MRDRIIFSSNYRIEKLNKEKQTFYAVPEHKGSYVQGEVYLLHPWGNSSEPLLVQLESFHIKYREEYYSATPESRPMLITTCFIEYVEMHCLVVETALERLLLLYGTPT